MSIDEDSAHPATDGASTRRRIAVQGMVILGGGAALSWEVVWQLQASLALGASARAAAVVLAATMAGMATGSLLCGRWLRGRAVPQPLRIYGLLEACIGLAGLFMPSGFAGLAKLDALVYPLAPALAPAIHALGIGLLLGPATFAMGASVPVFLLVARQFGTRVSVLYGLNTAGAAIGVLAIALVVLPLLGVTRSVLLIAGVNLLLFTLSRGLGSATAAPLPPAVQAETRSSSGISPAVAGWVVLGTGFVTFGLEVAWFRSLRAAFQTTTDTFAILLAAVLIPLAVGARLVPWLRRRGLRIGPVLLLSGVAVLLSTPLVERVDLFAPIAPDFWMHVAARLGLSLAILSPAVLLLGIALPWLLEEFPDPASSGRLYAANTAGAVAGSLSSAWILLPTLGFSWTAVGLGVLTTGLCLLLEPRLRVPVVAAATGAALIAVSQSSGLGRDRVQGMVSALGPYRIVEALEGPDSTVSVVETASGRRHLLIDGFVATSEFSSADYMDWMGRLPMLLHPDPKNALVICFGTGRTANAVRREGPEHVDVVDISQAVLDLAPHFRTNEGVLSDPRVAPHVMDGRAWLRRTERRYDVITLEPMPPTFAGMNALYSREFYEIVSERLAPGGVVAQWLPIHLLTPAQSVAVTRTFAGVFPDDALWLDPESMTGILLGRREMAVRPLGSEWPGLDRRSIPRPRSGQDIRRSLALDRLGVARFTAGAGLVTDDNQRLAYGELGGHHQQFQARRAVTTTIRRIAEARGAYPYARAPEAADLEFQRPRPQPDAPGRRLLGP